MSPAPKIMAVQGAAMLVAAALIVIGILGFIPGITANFDQLGWAGSRSGALLFGTIAVCAAVNIVHLVIGAAGFLFARSYAGARNYLLTGGAVYLALWLYGALVDFGSDAHVIPLNTAANWLHVILGSVMVLLGLTLGGQHDPTKRRPRLRRAATH